jgi:CheY-like chemotaxis protein
MLFEETILIAEDEDDEAFLLERALKKAEISPSIRRVKNGDQVIDYLNGAGIYADRNKFPAPIVVLLDLNMPKRNGFEVLEWVRRQPGLQTAAIDVFSGSSRHEDIERALQLGANLYLKKPVTLTELENLLQGYRLMMTYRGFPRP